jgi:hypothetical protein
MIFETFGSIFNDFDQVRISNNYKSITLPVTFCDSSKFFDSENCRKNFAKISKNCVKYFLSDFSKAMAEKAELADDTFSDLKSPSWTRMGFETTLL